MSIGIAALYSMEAVRYSFRVLRWLPRHERGVRTAHGLCPTCGYNLTCNVSGTCPECGANLEANVVDEQSSMLPALITEDQPWWVWCVVVAMMTLGVIVQRLFWG